MGGHVHVHDANFKTVRLFNHDAQHQTVFLYDQYSRIDPKLTLSLETYGRDVPNGTYVRMRKDSKCRHPQHNNFASVEIEIGGQIYRVSEKNVFSVPRGRGSESGFGDR